MRLLIDGNNVIHSAMPPALEGLGIEGLCRAIARTPLAREPVTLVCDGYPDPLGLLESPVPEVDLVFARRRTADDLIIERIDRDRSPRQLVVVSSDREIRLAARERGARSWTSPAFLTRLDEALRPQRPPAGGSSRGAGTPQKPAPEAMTDAEVDRWLNDFGVGEDNESDPLT